jgi:hypothetical protein
MISSNSLRTKAPHKIVGEIAIFLAQDHAIMFRPEY